MHSRNLRHLSEWQKSLYEVPCERVRYRQEMTFLERRQNTKVFHEQQCLCKILFPLAFRTSHCCDNKGSWKNLVFCPLCRKATNGGWHVIGKWHAVDLAPSRIWARYIPVIGQYGAFEQIRKRQCNANYKRCSLLCCPSQWKWCSARIYLLFTV